MSKDEHKNVDLVRLVIEWAMVGGLVCAYALLPWHSMDHGQKALGWAGIVLFELMGLFPPWKILSPGLLVSQYSSYFWIFRSAGSEGDYYPKTMGVDLVRLCIQWAMLAIVLSGVLITLKRRSSSRTS